MYMPNQSKHVYRSYETFIANIVNKKWVYIVNSVFKNVHTQPMLNFIKCVTYWYDNWLFEFFNALVILRKVEYASNIQNKFL